ncbi:hypothetical protein THAOC_17436 [Thalassiosira oceanica]|uniref:Uncharacterized protein n=1 Tax=Thalassiosira oceanica TaxID=159749 RepID=K0SAI7_THAOC|nr:hypothetical protein THAOC_17436 [Thalassiosira oceanica]|eukprot:EJK61979.1 hypothetical protein THAOC_17436 [Thalassiosira oceanica]
MSADLKSSVRLYGGYPSLFTKRLKLALSPKSANRDERRSSLFAKRLELAWSRVAGCRLTVAMQQAEASASRDRNPRHLSRFDLHSRTSPVNDEGPPSHSRKGRPAVNDRNLERGATTSELAARTYSIPNKPAHRPCVTHCDTPPPSLATRRELDWPPGVRCPGTSRPLLAATPWTAPIVSAVD